MIEMNDSNEILGAQTHIWNQTFSYMTSMALKCAVQLGIPDIISDHHDTPVILSELAIQLSIPQTKSYHLYRLMRLLVHTGFFVLKKDDQGREGYVHTCSSKLLSRKQQGNLVPLVQLFTDPIYVTPCLSVADWFHGTDSTSFESVHGTYIYDYCATHFEVGKRFDEAMANYSYWTVKPLLKDLIPMLEGFESLVDVGGGTGTLVKAISEALPHLRCTVYDLPRVISNIKDLSNVSLVAGDMFDFVPSANVILLKDVLMDWSDGECLKILKRCREAISRENNGQRVIIIDTVTNVSKGDWESIKADLCFDVLAMTCVKGKERTEIEWNKLFSDAGFTSFKITTILGFSSIFQIFP